MQTEQRSRSTPSVLPDIVVLLNVNLVKHHVFLLGVYVRFHLHGNVARKHREQETFLQTRREGGGSEFGRTPTRREEEEEGGGVKGARKS